MKKLFLSLSFLVFLLNAASAQIKIPTTSKVQTIQVNDMPIQTAVEGTMGSLLNTSYAISPLYTGGIWLGVYDFNAKKTKTACVFYTINSTDFWAGPIISNSDSIKFEMARKFDKIWTVSRYEIEQHKKDLLDGKLDFPQKSIMEWAGKGNPFFAQYNGFDLPKSLANEDLAPFKDTDKDGIYNPSKGDFPLPTQASENNIPEMIYWSISNDAASVHTQSKGDALNVEIHKTIWAYACQNSPAYKNAVYGSYKIINRNKESLDSMFVGQFSDIDLSCLAFDHAGTKIDKNTTFQYSSFTKKDTCKNSSYFPENTHTASAFTFLNKKISSSMFFENASVGPPAPYPATTDANSSVDYYRYLNAEWKDGSKLKKGGNGYSDNPAFLPTKFQYDGNPVDNSGWLDPTTNSKTKQHDSRSLLATYIGKLAPQASTTVDFAYSAYKVDTLKTYQQQLTDMYNGLDAIQSTYNDKFAKSCTNEAYCAGQNCIFPGDTNNDGIVDVKDYHNINLGLDKTGIARKNLNASWSPQNAGVDWTLNFSNGLNYKFADCNGDGILKSNDEYVVKNNFGNFNSFYVNQPDVYVDGNAIKVNINGSSSVQNSMGDNGRVRINLNLPAVAKTLSFQIEYDNRFFEPIKLSTGGKYYALANKNNKSTVDFFKISPKSVTKLDSFLLIEKSNLLTPDGLKVPEKCTYIRLKNILAYDVNGNEIKNLGSKDLTICYDKENVVKVEEATLPTTSVSISPNPFGDFFNIKNEVAKPLDIVIFDLTGRKIKSFSLLANDTQSIDTQDFNKGVYFVKCSDGKQFFTQKLVK